ncbi:dienelactone hydrolase [Globomyces pollinis-pini]|nr:dienelactone hydrolase [Globomyces pollinis-pini]KAJ3000226.1 hypothetical protein HDV02_000139 [Globomyces sp. JEL0801]
MSSSIPCCSGIVNPGIPQGKEDSIAGINCYVSNNTPTNSDTALIIATDVFGYKLSNPRIMCDSYAEATGFYSIVPDFFEGAELPESVMKSVDTFKSDQSSYLDKAFGFGNFVVQWPLFLLRNSATDSVNRIKKIIDTLKADKGIKKVVLVGYCWGGAVGIFLAQEPDYVDAVVSCHPGSFKIPGDVEKLIKPVYFVMAEKDFLISEAQANVIRDTLKKKDENGGYPHLFKWYIGMEHGFAVRGDGSDPEVKKSTLDAFQTSVDFLREQLAKLNKN